LKKIELTNLRSAYLSDTHLAVNLVLKRRINRGDIISVNNLSKPILIKKGDSVIILAKTNGFQISMKGTALVNGSKGDKIKVKNVRTKKIIQATVFDKHTVKVNL
jgi:flagella basal body P-ring formation protein FlgA